MERLGKGTTSRLRQPRNCKQLVWKSRREHKKKKSKLNRLAESKTRTYHGRFGSGLPADGGAGSGRTGCQQNCSPRGQGSLIPSRASKTRRLNVPPEARTSEIPFKPNAVTKSTVDKRLITGLSAVYHRDEKRSLFLAAD